MTFLAGSLSGFVKALLLLSAAALFGGEAEAQDQETKTYRDWVVRCAPREELPPCDMHQQVVDKKGRVIIELTVGYRPQEERYIFRAELPLGFLLPPGVLVKVDDATEFREFVVTRCIARGCLVEAAPSEELMQALRGGTAGQFVVATPEGRGLALVFSLRGFAAAADEMVARNSAS